MVNLSAKVIWSVCSFCMLSVGVLFQTPLPAAAQAADTQAITPITVPVLLTYRSSSVASKLAVEGAKMRAANAPNIVITTLDLDTEAGTLAAVRRNLSDSKTKAVLALEPSIDPGFPPLIDSLGLAVITTSYMEGFIPQSIKGLFSVYPRLAGVSDAVQRFFQAQPNVKKLMIVCSNSRLGVRYSEIWDEVGRQNGVSVPRPSCGNETSIDLRVELLRAKSQQVDGLAIGFGVLKILSRLRDMTFSKPLLLSATEGEHLISERAQDLSAFSEIFFDAPVFSEIFARAFSAQYDGRSPTISSALGYEAVTVLLKALEIGGDTVGAIRKVSYDGVSGPVNFTVENTGNGAKSVLMHVKSSAAVRMH